MGVDAYAGFLVGACPIAYGLNSDSMQSFNQPSRWVRSGSSLRHTLRMKSFHLMRRSGGMRHAVL